MIATTLRASNQNGYNPVGVESKMWGWLGTQGSAAKRAATLGCTLYPLRGKD